MQTPHTHSMAASPARRSSRSGWRLLLTVGIVLAVGSPAHAMETLRVLAWPGYADDDLVAAFEERHNVRVEVHFIGSDEMLREKISARQGADFDVFASNTAELQYFIDNKLVAPLRLANIPNIAHQLPRFQNHAGIYGITRPGAVFAIPYTYSEMGLIYDRKQFAEAPTSMSAMWDARYKGRVLSFDTSSHSFSIASLLLGGHPFHIRKDQFSRVAEHLVALRRNVLAFYSLPEESVELFQEHAIALMFANYGRQQLKLLRDAGADVGYIIPHEGVLAWIDCWAVTQAAKNRRLAEQWINYMLEPRVSGALTRRQGLSNTIEPDSASYDGGNILWLEPVEDAAQRERLWVRIMSGDRPGKLLNR